MKHRPKNFLKEGIVEIIRTPGLMVEAPKQ